MSWSQEFCEALWSRQLALVFQLRVRQITNESCDPTYKASSAVMAGCDPILKAPRINGASASPQGRSVTLGGFSIELHGDTSRLLQAIRRGTVVEVWCGLAGWLESRFQRIALGQVSQFRREISGQQFIQVLECRDILSALRSRITATSTQLGLFYDVDSTTTLSASYTVGDSSLSVASSTLFTAETGGLGALLVGDFYLYWSAKGAGSFTLDTPASDRHGTTRASAASGTEVVEVARLYGHPIDIFRKVLTSTGNATNGAYDTLPVGWGLALPQEWLSNSEMDLYRARVDSLTSPGFNLDILVAEEQADPLSWMLTWLSPCGLVPMVVQGDLSCRALQTSYDASTNAVRKTDIVISDDDFTSLSWEAWDSETPAEFAIATAHTGASVGTASSTLENDTSLPGRYRAEFDLSEILFENTSAIATEIVERCAESAGTRIPERITLTGRLWMAQLAPLDIVTLNTSRFTGRFSYNASGYAQVPVVVIQVSPDWSRGTCRVVLLCYPSGGDAFP